MHRLEFSVKSGRLKWRIRVGAVFAQDLDERYLYLAFAGHAARHNQTEGISRHDWDKTKELLAPNVHASVTTTMPTLGGSEFTGIDNYMALKVKAARLIEPGSVQVIGTIGDESNALTLVTFRIGLGPGGTMVTMARACLYLLDENKKIKEERDSFFVLSSKL